ncbi:MAG: hypothetical protein P4L85_18565 [Paludisphaera borealis]|uniref:hypothetical protein n=1 Tax=Paludisphaera borealis TaxID=1387353 RepID=UPI00284D9493|nr:hypothetical protein [Paludisphaera borealis]MDR3621361.1 hypothetical protein [Paludisphaera borealis]
MLTAIALRLWLAPPWPARPLVGLLTSSAILIATFWAAMTIPRFAYDRLPRLARWTAIFFAAYCVLWAFFVHDGAVTTPENGLFNPVPKVPGGWMYTQTAKEFMELEATSDPSVVLANAEFNANEVWVTWTLNLTAAALLITWLAFSLAVGAFVVELAFRVLARLGRSATAD